MEFLVALDPFCLRDEHRYFVAELDGRAVAFLSTVPVFARGAWLVQDVLRGGAPNGTTEMLFLAFMRETEPTATVSLGLAPLRGKVLPWLRAARALGRPLFDFAGLHAFKERLHPTRWEPVWLVFPRGERAFAHIVETLRAFASGNLLRFGLRSLVRRPQGATWAAAVLLALWASMLTLVALADRAAVLGVSRASLVAVAGCDAILAMTLLRLARKPKLASLVGATMITAADATLSVVNHGISGTPHAAWRVAARFAEMVGPIMASVGLVCATILWLVRRNGSTSRASATSAARPALRRGIGAFLLAILFSLVAHAARAQDPFEIQVYDSETAAPLETGIELHTNYFGRRGTVNASGPATDRVFHVTCEPHLGLADWAELGGYIQTAILPDGSYDFAGAKLRFKARVPWKLAGHVGVALNTEVSRVPRAYSESRVGAELRPIVDLRLGRAYVSINPILDFDFGRRPRRTSPARAGCQGGGDAAR